MFEDQPIKSNGSTIPSNLPVGEPGDMFAGVEKEGQAEAVLPASAGGFGSALSAGVLKAKAPSAAPEEPKYIVPPQTTEIYNIKEPTLIRALLIAVGVIIIIAAVGGGGWWAYGYFMKEKTAPATADTAIAPAVPASEEVQPATAAEPANTDISADVADEQILFGEPIDKDGDGLDDSREAELGTDPNNWDTDNDGLSDGDEALIWKTDPLKSDSDGDGFLDGQEVKNGYNPAGPGKIFEPPKQ